MYKQPSEASPAGITISRGQAPPPEHEMASPDPRTRHPDLRPVIHKKPPIAPVSSSDLKPFLSYLTVIDAS